MKKVRELKSLALKLDEYIGGDDAAWIDRDDNGIDDACDSGEATTVVDDSKNFETSTTVNNTQSATSEHSVIQKSSTSLTDANLYFGAVFDTQTFPNTSAGRISTNPSVRAATEPAVSQKTNIQVYALMALTVLIVTFGIMVFIKRKRF